MNSNVEGFFHAEFLALMSVDAEAKLISTQQSSWIIKSQVNIKIVGKSFRNHKQLATNIISKLGLLGLIKAEPI